jgi:hypothetical protein
MLFNEKYPQRSLRSNAKVDACMEFVLVAYGSNLGYVHGAKYQIIKLIQTVGHIPDVCVVTDNPLLFQNYPCRVLILNPEKINDWSLGGYDHFGIKLQGLLWAAKTTNSPKVLLLDTDMYWIKDPRELGDRITRSSVVLYQNEGSIIGAKNLSLQRFEEGLLGKVLMFEAGEYSLSYSTEMWGSAMIGLSVDNMSILESAFELFNIVSKEVKAHTIEQFALSEVLRLRGINRTPGKRFVGNWSSTGRKNYVTPLLAEFFSKYGEHDFEAHVNALPKIKIQRPLKVFLTQKIKRWNKK